MMAEYIDKEKLLQKLSRMIDYCENDNKVSRLTALFQVGDAIVDCPTADMIQVVRCKDCAIPHNRWTGCPKLNGLVTAPNFYCSYGERRKERCQDILMLTKSN